MRLDGGGGGVGGGGCERRLIEAFFVVLAGGGAVEGSVGEWLMEVRGHVAWIWWGLRVTTWGFDGGGDLAYFR